MLDFEPPSTPPRLKPKTMPTSTIWKPPKGNEIVQINVKQLDMPLTQVKEPDNISKTQNIMKMYC